MESDYLTCLVCLELAKEAVESECCNTIYCNACADSINTSRNKACPKCRHEPFKYRNSVLARRMIGSMPYDCPHCKQNMTLDDFKGHTMICPKIIRKCHINSCKFTGTMDEFFAHLAGEHKKEVLSAFDEETKLAISAEKPKMNQPNPANNNALPSSDPIQTKVNSGGRMARLGSTGKYYCGGSLEGKCCGWLMSRCDGKCGPTNGCNCRACMMLDIQAKNLPKGFLVNKEGATCRRGETGRIYCGRKMDIPGSDGYCGPTDGPQCKACKSVDEQLQGRYQGLIN